MKNLRYVYATIICAIYSSMSAQYKIENKNVIAEFKVMDARDNGEDISPQMIPDNGRLIIYKSELNNQIMLSNFWEKSQSQSYGPIKYISKEQTPESKDAYGTEELTFNWEYTNTYDEIKGIAKIKIFIKYKPQGKYFELTIIPEDLTQLVYKGEMNGNMKELDSYIGN